MISFATVEKIDGDIVKLHLDMYPEFCRAHARRKWKKPYIIYDELKYVKRFIPSVSEGDVLVVEHSQDSIISYLEKDYDEKQRRIEHLKKIYQCFRR